MNSKYEQIIKEVNFVRVGISETMAPHTTFKIGGPADLFVEIKNENDLTKVLAVAKNSQIPYFILGGGSNVLIGDKGVRGLTVKISNFKFQISNLTNIEVGAGLPLSLLLDKCVENSLTGLEFMAGIPGTVGGAVRGNSGAWQKNFSDRIIKVKVLTPSGEIEEIDKKDCLFAYRESRFKKSGDIILEAEIALEKAEGQEIKKRIKVFLEKRACQPKEPSAGCVFVNPKPLSAGQMIDQCGLKGKSFGGAKVSEEHANFIVNTGGARAVEVVSLIELVKKAVKEKFNIDLQEEIVRVGEF